MLILFIVAITILAIMAFLRNWKYGIQKDKRKFSFIEFSLCFIAFASSRTVEDNISGKFELLLVYCIFSLVWYLVYFIPLFFKHKDEANSQIFMAELGLILLILPIAMIAASYI